MKKLISSITKKDLEIQTFRSGGKGGQHQNTCESGVRIIHRDSGARGECRNFRSQKQNKDKALCRMTKDPRFRAWVSKMAFGFFEIEKRINRLVDESLKESNLKIEVFKNGKWNILSNKGN
jgi:hypothetical protein